MAHQEARRVDPKTGASSSAVSLRVLVLRDGPWWVAQCLEHDLVAQATTLPELELRFHRVIVGTIALALERGEEPFAEIAPAPKACIDMYENGSRHVDIHFRAIDINQVNYPRVQISAPAFRLH